MNNKTHYFGFKDFKFIHYNKDIFNNFIDKNKARDKLGLDKDKFIVIFHGSYFLANKQAIDIIKDKIAPRIQDKDILFLIAGKLPNSQPAKSPCQNNCDYRSPPNALSIISPKTKLEQLTGILCLNDSAHQNKRY